MTRRNWHVLRDGPRLTLTRRLPVRFDVEVCSSLPRAGRLRVATQVRQDIWRALQGQRGFSPVIEITTGEGGEMTLRAGGRVDGAPFERARLEERIADVLGSPTNRQRWLRGSRGAESMKQVSDLQAGGR